jgi:hypothetical protein
VNSEIRFSPLFSLDGIKEKNPYIRDLELRDTLDKENPDFRSVSSIFHYDGYKAKYQNESNEYLFNLIDEYQPGSLKMESFEQITIQKILYLSALRVWIEKVLFEKLIQGHPERESEWKSEKKQQFGSRIEYVTEGQCKDDFHRCFPNVTRGSLMMKKTMINQDEHPGSRVAAFGYAMNISLFDLDKEIVDIKSLMEG